LYATSRSGIVKVHKNGGNFTYVVPKEDGYSFRYSDIIKYPSGDFIVVDADSENGGIFELNNKCMFSKENSELYNGIYLADNGKIYIISNGDSAELKID
jgi:hypothetical protein